jgi:anti-anti-sigma regulatory factor
MDSPWPRLRSQGGRLALISVNPDLRQLFGRVHFDLVIPIYPSLTQVLEAWPPDE